MALFNLRDLLASGTTPTVKDGCLHVRRFCLTFAFAYGPEAMILTVTAKGQVTLRKELLQHLGVQPGEKIVVEKLPDGRIEVKAARPAGRISDVFNMLKRDDAPSLSVDQINQIAAEGWAGER
jgi:AbrB family looped-hinge helix DNA binding protein